jgi:hypothetical protein
MPRIRVLDVGDPPIDLANDGGLVQGGPDERVHLASRIDVAHPVIAIRPDPKPVEGINENLGVVASVRGVAIRLLVRNVRERLAHRVGDSVRRQERLGVHRIHVVDAVEIRDLKPARPHRANDDVEENGTTQAADVDSPRRRLRVVDDLRPADALCEFVSPVLGRMASRGSASDLGGRLPGHRGGWQLTITRWL